MGDAGGVLFDAGVGVDELGAESLGEPVDGFESDVGGGDAPIASPGDAACGSDAEATAVSFGDEGFGAVGIGDCG